MIKMHYIPAVRKSVDVRNRTVTAWASTAALDRDNEVILAGAWQHADSTKEFEANPCGLVGHDYKSLPIFKVTKLWKTPRGLKFTAQFLNTAAGREAFSVIAESGLSSFSVAFVPVSWQDLAPSEVAKRHGIDCSAAKGRVVRCYDHVKLLEISLVALPANIEATAVGAAFESGMLKSPELALAVKSLKPRAKREMSSEEIKRYFAGSAFKDAVRAAVREEITIAFDKARGKVY